MKNLKSLSLGKSLNRAEMKKVNGGTTKEWQCWCDGIRNGYCDGDSSACCNARC
jgi:natural product precursor